MALSADRRSVPYRILRLYRAENGGLHWIGRLSCVCIACWWMNAWI